MIDCNGFIKINLLNTGKSEVGTEWNYPDITSAFSRIIYCVKGAGMIYHQKECYALKPGTMVLVPSFVRGSYVCLDSMELYYVHFINELPNNANLFDFYDLKYLLSEQQSSETSFERLSALHGEKGLMAKDPKIYQTRLWMQKRCCMADDPAVFYETQGIIIQLLSKFLMKNKGNKLGGFLPDSVIRKIVIYIGENIDRAISTLELAELSGYSADHFTRLFKQHYDLTPKQYINNRRVEYAQMLLKTTRMNVAEVAIKSGFENRTYFSTVFKQITGYNPAYFRKSVNF